MSMYSVLLLVVVLLLLHRCKLMSTVEGLISQVLHFANWQPVRFQNPVKQS